MAQRFKRCDHRSTVNGGFRRWGYDVRRAIVFPQPARRRLPCNFQPEIGFQRGIGLPLRLSSQPDISGGRYRYEEIHLAPSPSFRNRIPRPSLPLRARLCSAWRWSQRRWWRLARRGRWRFPRRSRLFWRLPRWWRLQWRLSWRRSRIQRSGTVHGAWRWLPCPRKCKCRTSLVLGRSQFPRRIPRMASVSVQQLQDGRSRSSGQCRDPVRRFLHGSKVCRHAESLRCSRRTVALLRRTTHRDCSRVHNHDFQPCRYGLQQSRLARQQLGWMARRLAWRMGLGLARLELGMGLGLLRLGFRIRLGLGRLGSRLGLLGSVLGMAVLLVRPLDLRRCLGSLCPRSLSRIRSLSACTYRLLAHRSVATARRHVSRC